MWAAQAATWIPLFFSMFSTKCTYVSARTSIVQALPSIRWSTADDYRLQVMTLTSADGACLAFFCFMALVVPGIAKLYRRGSAEGLRRHHHRRWVYLCHLEVAPTSTIEVESVMPTAVSFEPHFVSWAELSWFGSCAPARVFFFARAQNWSCFMVV